MPIFPGDAFGIGVGMDGQNLGMSLRTGLSGTATASNKSRFMAMSPVSGFAPRPNSSPPRRSDNAVQKISDYGPCQMHGGISTEWLAAL
jgi:hypothetical protein